MANGLSFFQRHRRGIAGFVLALLLQSLAWGAGAASSADVLESEGANAAIHEQGCTDDAGVPAGQETDSHCNEACHFWSQFQMVFASDAQAAMAASPVLQPAAPVFVFDNRTSPPFRPPRIALTA